MAGAASVVLTALGVAAWPRLSAMLDPQVAFDPIPGLPGFRRERGAPAAPANALAGLSGQGAPDAAPGLSVCDLLFTETRSAGDVPLAYFSDYRCTFCRRLSPRLAALAQTSGISLTWHELPLLGPDSTLGARAALASGSFGGDVTAPRALPNDASAFSGTKAAAAAPTPAST